MATPANSVAEIIVRTISANEGIQWQIDELTKTLTQNLADIAELEPLAEWN